MKHPGFSRLRRCFSSARVRAIPAAVSAAVRLPALVVAAVLLAAVPHRAFALDDLFDDPDSGVVEEGEAIGDETDPADEEQDRDADDRSTSPFQGVDIDALTTSPVTFSGSVNTGAGIAFGLLDWPDTRSPDMGELWDLRQLTAGYDMSATMRVTARPKPHLRFTGSLTTELNEDTARFTTPSIGSLFVDYTLRDSVFIRAGKYSMTWGQARLLPNIGNLVDDVSDGAAMRATVPAGPGTITGIIWTRREEIDRHGSGHPRSFTYAGQYETTRGRVSTGIGARARSADTLNTTAYVTLGLGTIDVTQEAIIRWDREDPFDEDTLDFSTLTQMIWEFGSPVWRVIAEYGFDYAVDDWEGHRVGLGIRMPQYLPRSWRPQVTWRHAFQDDSGQIAAGFTGTLAPDISGSIGIPVRYGKPGTIYRGGDFDSDIPTTSVIAVGIGARLRFSF